MTHDHAKDLCASVADVGPLRIKALGYLLIDWLIECLWLSSWATDTHKGLSRGSAIEAVLFNLMALLTNQQIPWLQNLLTSKEIPVLIAKKYIW